MNKLVVWAVGVIAVAVIVVLAIPVVSAYIWRSEATTNTSQLLVETTAHTKGSIEFLGSAEPTDAQYDTEIASLRSVIEKTRNTIRDLEGVGPNTVDITGQYAQTKELQQELVGVLDDIASKYESQLDILNGEKSEGVTAESAEKYSEITDGLNEDYARLENVVNRL